MNGVLTHKELEKLRKLKKEKAPEPVAEIKPVAEPEPVLPKIEVSQENFFLFHPDNPRNSNYLNQVHKVEIGGILLDIPIVNGVLKTDNVEAKNKLIQSGFVLMYSRPKGEDNE